MWFELQKAATVKINVFGGSNIVQSGTQLQNISEESGTSIFRITHNHRSKNLKYRNENCCLLGFNLV